MKNIRFILIISLFVAIFDSCSTEGGYGLFSSRTQIEKTVSLSANTIRELFGMTSWGFKEQ